MQKKLIVSGNGKYGLAGELSKSFPDSHFASRSSGWNLSKSEEHQRFALKTLNYSVYISCSALNEFNQVILLEKVIAEWKRSSHIGRIIAIGSSADASVKGTDWLYPIEKKALKAYCRNLSNMCLGFKEFHPMNFRVTYLSVGHLNTPKANEKHPGVDKLDLKYITSIISWILEQPMNVNINEISVDPIHYPK